MRNYSLHYLFILGLIHDDIQMAKAPINLLATDFDYRYDSNPSFGINDSREFDLLNIREELTEYNHEY